MMKQALMDLWFIPRLRKRFPDVRTIDTETLSQYLKGNGRLVLIDCRDDAEVKISRIPSSIHLPVSSNLEEISKKLPQGPKRVVTYCGIGIRSARMARRITEIRPDIRPLSVEGGIFKWANENRTMVDSSGHETKKVYSKKYKYAVPYLNFISWTMFSK